jgi:1-acyl-sn-glycerol-3-phosphate acyltransferase
MIPVFLFAIVASFMGHIRGGNLIYRACMVWGDLWFPMIGIFSRNIYEQPLHPDQSYIFVANHISYLDALILVKGFRHPVRPLAKAEMGKVPVFGFIYRKAVVSVDRSNAANRAKSVQLLKSILRKGISVLVFPEGTFNTTRKPLKDFYDGAFRIAIETGTPIKPVLFLDTYDRLHYNSIFSLTPGKNRFVFLDEIPTQGLTIRDTAMLKDKVYLVIENKLRAYKASWIKEGD